MAQPFFASTDNVDQALQGFARSNRDVVALHIGPIVVRAVAPDPRRRVGVVSGGGSGHEPMHIGLVGRGMLDAAVPRRCSPRRTTARCSGQPGGGRVRRRAARREELHR